MTSFGNERSVYGKAMVPAGEINRAKRYGYVVEKPKRHTIRILGFPWILFRILVVVSVLIGIGQFAGAHILVDGLTGASDQHKDDAAALLKDLLPSANEARRIQALHAVAQAKDRRFI